MKATKLPSGNYRVRIFVKTASGKQIRKSFTGPGKKEVEREAQRYLLDHKEAMTAEVTNRTFKDAEEAFLLAREAVLSPATVRTYKSAQKCLALYFPWLMNTNIHDLTTDHLQRIVDELVKKNMKPKSVRNYYGFITVILDYNRIRLAPPRLPQKERSTLNIPDEATVKRVIELAEGTELEVPVMLAAFGPLRRGEICALTMDDIDGNVIHVCKDMVLNDAREWVVKPPKTFSSDRYVTMPDRVINRIEKQGYVTNYDPNGLSYAFSTLLKQNGIEHFRFHDLRHFCCSYLHGMNVPDVYIMQRSGHSTNSTLRNVYTHTLQDQNAEETKRILKQFNAIF